MSCSSPLPLILLLLSSQVLSNELRPAHVVRSLDAHQSPFSGLFSLFSRAVDECPGLRKECGTTCIPLGTTCCGYSSGHGYTYCPIGERCDEDDDGDPGCCDIGKTCTGEGGVITSTRTRSTTYYDDYTYSSTRTRTTSTSTYFDFDDFSARAFDSTSTYSTRTTSTSTLERTTSASSAARVTTSATSTSSLVTPVAASNAAPFAQGISGQTGMASLLVVGTIIALFL